MLDIITLKKVQHGAEANHRLVRHLTLLRLRGLKVEAPEPKSSASQPGPEARPGPGTRSQTG